MPRLSLLCLALLLSAGRAAADPSPRVETASGPVEGAATKAGAAFKGIPYAAAPTGSRRWAPPEPPPSWSRPLNAQSFGPACPQKMNANGSPNAGGAAGPMSEDCLTLNVFAPTGARRAPVMVWIYGGGNVAGASSVSAYDGGGFTRDGIVLVTLNYRLGALGFFAHPALTAAAPAGAPLGSYGLMDQIAALKWVRANIAGFGGDPANVTLFGESAGGADTLALMSTPAARGLFSKAIVESGGGWGEPVTLAAAEKVGAALAESAGLGSNPSAAQLRALPVADLVAAQGRFGPIVDGRLLRQSPTETFRKGEEAKVPLIIGSNSFEASLIAMGPSPAAVIAAQPAAVLPAYRDEPDERAKAFALFTDGAMGGPARWIARRQSEVAQTWLYYFSFRRAAYAALFPGAPHASEIPFVFDSWSAIDPRLSRGAETPADAALTEVMHACWVAFAKTGRPSCPTPEPWVAYGRGADGVMEFGETSGLRHGLNAVRLDAQEKARAAMLSPGL